MWAVVGRVALNVAAQMMQTEKGRLILLTVVGAVAVVPLLFPLLVASSISGAVAQQQASTMAAAEEEENACFTGVVTGPQNATTWADLDADQQANATIIVGVVKSATVVAGGTDDLTQQRAAVVAIATAMQESKLYNLDGGDRDSLGLFQQRPTQAWGTEAEIKDPIYATTAFLYGAGTNPGLVDVQRWPTYPLTVVAQAVQRSGVPTAYAPWAGLAQEAVDVLWPITQMAGLAPVLDRPELGDATTARMRPVTISMAAGSGEGCGLLGEDAGPVSEWDGVYTKPMPWGGPPPYENGRIPLAAMCLVPWDLAEMGRCDAVDQLIALDIAWQNDHNGEHIPITDSYRTYDEQVSTKRAKGKLAATPGTSNHGLGMALDLSGFGHVGQYDKPNYLWMLEHGPRYGWVSPPWAFADGAGPHEPWHWEFMGTPVHVVGDGPTAVTVPGPGTPSPTPTTAATVTEPEMGEVEEQPAEEAPINPWP